MAGIEDDVTASDPETPDEPSQALAVGPPVPQAAPTTSASRYYAIGAGVVLAGVATVVLLSARSSARESLPSNPVKTDGPLDAARKRPRFRARPPASCRTGAMPTQARWVSNHPKSAAFELAADRDVPVWMRRVHPLLVVRCLARKADVFVFTDSPARIEPEDENHTIHVAFDDEAGTTERWMDSEEHDALFAPDGPSFARRLAHSHTLTFGFTPHNAAPVSVQFTTRGFDKILEQVSVKCRM